MPRAKPGSMVPYTSRLAAVQRRTKRESRQVAQIVVGGSAVGAVAITVAMVSGLGLAWMTAIVVFGTLLGGSAIARLVTSSSLDDFES